ncbi:MAG TPA: FAD-dependent oxidoreductase [Terriglobales bacterium]|nr:FAD-dependent oxidoreductase [Terriglobales bacterium]
MYDLIIIGGGPAGTAAAITSARSGARVLILEQGRFPRHKVCGEFVSAESLSLLKSLLPDTRLVDHAPRIPAARIFLDGRQLYARIHPPAASISRFDLDLALWRAAEQAGAEARLQTPVQRLSGNGPFVLEAPGAAFEGRSVINASGRWSTLSPRLASPQKWLGIKAHFHEPSPPCSVDLYFVKSGYCGVQPLGPDLINVSAMVRAEAATTLPDILSLHPALAARSRCWRPATEPVATSPLFLRRPEPLRGHILLAGDAAGFVDPFVGDGIALALRTGAAATQSLLPFLRGEASLPTAGLAYQRLYQQNFLPIFSNAARYRRLLRLPGAVRAPFVRLLARTGLPAFVVRSTRGATAASE